MKYTFKKKGVLYQKFVASGFPPQVYAKELSCDIGLFKAVVLALVFCLQPKGKSEGDDSKAGEDEHGEGVVIKGYYVAIALYGAHDAIVAQHVADQEGHTAQADVLHPED